MSIKSTIGLGLIAAALSAPAAAAVIDFSAYADGTAITTIGSATFSLAGAGESGSPSVMSVSGVGYLWNSTDGFLYPTNEILRVTFSSPVSNLKFDFSPFGYNGEADQGWSLYDSANALIASGAFTSDFFASYDLSAFAGVARVDFNNGRNDWVQGLARISFDVTAVPAPTTPALMLTAFLALAAVRRSRGR